MLAVPQHETFLDGRVTLHAGNCLDVLARLEECSIDGCVTDPPYHLQSIHKRFAAKGRDETSERYAAGPYGRTAKGFMGKQWDGGNVAFRVETWAAIYRVLKPGAHLVAFGGTRTYHRMACAIEEAGFEIRDQLQWLYGSGFPKSHDVIKGIDRAAGVEREVIAQGAPVKRTIPGADQNKAGWEKNNGREFVPSITRAATNEAAQWEGWGTALKPACEPIVLARKPLSESTVAANVLKLGTGALNIDGCRVATEEDIEATRNVALGSSSSGVFGAADKPGVYEQKPGGRWPANVIHDGSEEVVEKFPSEAGAFAPVRGTEPSNSIGTVYNQRDRTATFHHGDSGSAARFFYTAKADSFDRIGSKHPTVKPLDLMQWLVRLIAPKGAVVLDPFAGTGTTGEAAWAEGLRAMLIEREPEYQADIRRRMALVLAGPDERARESIKARGQVDEPGPLFAQAAE